MEIRRKFAPLEIQRGKFTYTFCWKLVPTIPKRMAYVIKVRMLYLIGRTYSENAFIVHSWGFVAPFFIKVRDE